MGSDRAGAADPRSFDRFAAGYDRYVSLEPAGLPRWLLDHLPTRRGRALDAGCGSGRHTLALADRFDEVVGVDLSRPLIDIARRRRGHPRVRYLAGDLLGLIDPDGFDLVLSVSALHHLDDLDAALRHLRGLVAPGGAVVLVDNVAQRPTPPRWVYLAGAVRDLPGDLRRHGWRQAAWRLRFRTGAPFLGHLASDRYLTRQGFEERYGAAFPGARFQRLGHTHALIWRDPRQRRRRRVTAGRRPGRPGPRPPPRSPRRSRAAAAGRPWPTATRPGPPAAGPPGFAGGPGTGRRR
jgi:SAM-dependent methyltransferase